MGRYFIISARRLVTDGELKQTKEDLTFNQRVPKTRHQSSVAIAVPIVYILIHIIPFKFNGL